MSTRECALYLDPLNGGNPSEFNRPAFIFNDGSGSYCEAHLTSSPSYQRQESRLRQLIPESATALESDVKLSLNNWRLRRLHSTTSSTNEIPSPRSYETHLKTLGVEEASALKEVWREFVEEASPVLDDDDEAITCNGTVSKGSLGVKRRNAIRGEPLETLRAQ